MKALKREKSENTKAAKSPKVHNLNTFSKSQILCIRRNASAGILEKEELIYIPPAYLSIAKVLNAEAAEAVRCGMVPRTETVKKEFGLLFSMLTPTVPDGEHKERDAIKSLLEAEEALPLALEDGHAVHAPGVAPPADVEAAPAADAVEGAAAVADAASAPPAADPAEGRSGTATPT